MVHFVLVKDSARPHGEIKIEWYNPSSPTCVQKEVVMIIDHQLEQKTFSQLFFFGFFSESFYQLCACVPIKIDQTNLFLTENRAKSFVFCQLIYFFWVFETQSQLFSLFPENSILTKVSNLFCSLETDVIENQILNLWFSFFFFLSSSSVLHLFSAGNILWIYFKSLNNFPSWSFHVHWCYWSTMFSSQLSVAYIYIFIASLWSHSLS